MVDCEPDESRNVNERVAAGVFTNAMSHLSLLGKILASRQRSMLKTRSRIGIEAHIEN
jgi:hypothetical protein